VRCGVLMRCEIEGVTNLIGMPVLSAFAFLILHNYSPWSPPARRKRGDVYSNSKVIIIIRCIAEIGQDLKDSSRSLYQ
jgi:hypothetical protein